MSDRIPNQEIRKIIIDAIGDHSCLLEAQLAGEFVVPARDRAIELALPLGPRLAQKMFNKMPEETRVEIEDLEQASRIGVMLGIDRYNPSILYQSPTDKKAGRPGRPIQVNTYCQIWVRKFIFEEIAETHWRVAKPTREDRERFFNDSMSHDERVLYAHLVLTPKTTVDVRFDLAEWVSERDWAASRDREAML